MNMLLKKFKKIVTKYIVSAKWKVGHVLPGHYYSPVNDIKFIKENKEKLFNYNKVIKDIDLKFEAQQSLLKALKKYYDLLPFPKKATAGWRYYFENNFFSFSDATFLYCLLNYIKPSKVIEIGSGFSSACMLDTNDKFFDGKIDFTFIEPYPEERLYQLIDKNEQEMVVKQFIQDVDVNIFTTLKANDILFVDSSHVSKFKSDLNHILFEILPLLSSGVYIHFHDIFFPFEYPKEWILEERSWTEVYLLRAFLMNNNQYEIVLFPSMMEQLDKNWLQENMPLTLEVHEKRQNADGSEYYLPHMGQSLWLKKR